MNSFPVMAKPKKEKESNALEKNLSDTYNAYKEFEGRRYTGMKIGRGHRWKYDPGEWKEKKVSPDEWEISFQTTKRRAARAPEGSGVPVGTEYHWYIIAHQNVTKLNANDYSTAMSGLKFKLAHKRAEKSNWSASPRAQRKHAIRILQGVIKTLEESLAEEEEEKSQKKPEKKAA